MAPATEEEALAVVVGGAAPVLVEVVTVGGEAADAGGVGFRFAELVIGEDAEELGVNVGVDAEKLAGVVAFGFVLVDVLIGAEGVYAAGGIGGVIRAGQGRVDVAREIEVHAVGEHVVD